jgi:hypothetical protein
MAEIAEEEKKNQRNYFGRASLPQNNSYGLTNDDPYSF